ncbi:MAG: peptidyl-prolyl cis-trans isomerase [Saprospiraceae bacterium]|nr:peptidyl-prolyl cis-trans isomerase [Saprospiraceae bacterium]
MKKFLYALICLAALAIWQCGGDTGSKANDKPLAKVYNKTLFLSALEGVVPEGISPEDSTLVVAAYIQRWTHEQLLMYEAERNIPKDLDIDELVRNYRASLVRYNFEEQIIAERLDSIVSEEELVTFYGNNKDQFQLESTILKCLILKIPASDPVNELNKLWNSRNPADETKLKNLARQKATLALLDPEKWYKLDEIAAILPKGTLSSDNVASRKDGNLSDGDFRYYYRVLETAQGKTTAPFDYVREQASRIILHKRKQDLLDRWKEDLYQRELKRENVQILK